MERLTARTSTIFIATGHETKVYRSVDEIPAELRRKLSEYTRGMNAATILIADKRGREELVRALQGRSSEVHCRLADTLRQQHEAAAPAAPTLPRAQAIGVQVWLELLLPIAVAVSLWIATGYHP